MKTIKAFFSILAEGLVVGLITGGVIGALEITVLLPTTGGTALNFLMPAVVFYGITLALLALLLGAVFFPISRILRIDFKDRALLTC